MTVNEDLPKMAKPSPDLTFTRYGGLTGWEMDVIRMASAPNVDLTCEGCGMTFPSHDVMVGLYPPGRCGHCGGAFRVVPR